MRSRTLRILECVVTLAFVLMGVICAIVGIHDGSFQTILLGVLLLLHAGLILGVKPMRARQILEKTDPKTESTDIARNYMTKKLLRIIILAGGYSLTLIYTIIGIMLFIPGIFQSEAGLIVFGIMLLTMAVTLFFRLPIHCNRRNEEKRLKTERKHQQGFSHGSTTVFEAASLKGFEGESYKEERYASEPKGPSLWKIIQLMTDTPHGSMMNRCNGDCANCPPHYGYRYGRWYYGHHHRHGCEFGGNKGI